MKLYSNWQYEYVGYDLGWADMQRMLAAGEIDMVISAVKTPERAEIYDFSDDTVSQSGACLMVKAGESPYVAGQYDSYNGMRIGFIENASQIAKTESFAKEKGFVYTPVYYKTSAELENAIATGTEVDAVVTSNMRIIAGTRRLELFAMQDVYAMVRKGNSELLSEINHALTQINLYNPTLFSSLYNKYYSVETGDAVFFSPDESEFIAECRSSDTPLRMAVIPELSPYSFYQGDEPAGILYDIASEIVRRTGVRVELVPTPSDEEYDRLVQSGGADIWLTALFDYNDAEAHGETLTTPYFSTDVSRITRNDANGEIRSVAVLNNGLIEKYYLPAMIQNERIVRYDSVAECLRAVLNRECDAVYLMTQMAQEAVYLNETNRLTSAIMPRVSIGFSIGVRDGVDSRLTSALEKAAASLDEEDIAAIVLRYTNYPSREMTLLGVLYNNPLIVIAAVALLLTLIFAGVMLIFVTRKRSLEREKNAQLQVALASAKQANSAKSMFMSRMSHEIRTPLNAIIGYNSISSNALAEAKSEPEYRQATMRAMDSLSKCDIASKQLLSVINDVLDMSAIESGKIKIAREPFDFKSAISALTVMFYAQAKAKGVDLHVNFDAPTEEWFVGDQMRLNQILTNLLSNAIKFTPEGGSVRLAIRETRVQDDAATIRFEVADTGIGMEEDFLSSIWSPFEQADASISRRFGGTGLGLSITKNLVDLMGGSVSVQSAPGKGSTFTVDLPLARMRQPESENVYDFSNLSVLVVDDDRSTCDYLKLLFDRYSVKCTAVASGQEAVENVNERLSQGKPYSACVVDWHMPEMDGRETIKRIRERAGEETPIIVISAYDFSDIEPAAKTLGVNAFIAKPLFQSAVFDLLVNISGKRHEALVMAPRTDAFHGERVLLVEDNRTNMEIAKAILRSWKLVIDEAWNGLEAVERFCSAPEGTYKAILMDVHMPEMDGYRATQAIRASDHAEARSIPIIAMTADVFAEDVSEAMAAGMNDHIGKPIDKALLLSTLQKYIKG